MTCLTNAAAHIDTAISSGLQFLIDAAEPDGLWPDFMTRAGRSIDWVSGYVVTMIAGLPRSGEMCERALRSLVRRQRRSGGWAYNELIPEDCDSTAWVLRAILTGRFIQPAIIRSALACICAHQDHTTGGFRTYVLLDRISKVVGRADRSAVRGWGGAHLCVSANATVAMMECGMLRDHPVLVRALDYLERSRDASGLWSSYWWSGPLAGTYYAMLALAMAGRVDASGRLETALRVAQRATAEGGWGNEPGDPANAFATAHSLLALSIAPPYEIVSAAIRGGTEWLLKRQRQDGSWPTVPILRIPDPEASDVSTFSPSCIPMAGTNILVQDDRHVFTTAVTLRALSRCRRTIPAKLAGD